MIKRLKAVILILMHFLLLQGVCGQGPSTMTDYLSQKFLRYCKSVPREEVFIHFDRNDYISGEDIWFNVYLTDRQSFKPSPNSRIVYFELLNSENRPVVQKRILIYKGFGPGQMALPDTLSSGIYTVRAYTSWMKNFLPYNCFLKNITIYNSLSNSTFKGRSNADKFVIQGTVKNIIPEIKNKGVTLKVNNSKHDILELFVDADNKFRSENNNIIYIFIQTHGNINLVSAEKLEDETTRITLSKVSLTPGVNQITIFDSKGEPVTERYIYTSFRNSNLISIQFTDSCKLRSKIKLEIGPGSNADHRLTLSNLSISVAPATSNEGEMDIADYLVLGTEFGLIGQNKIMGKKINELLPEMMDSILENVRSNWIDWSKILAWNLPNFKYPIENENHFLMGKLMADDQQPVHSNEILLMCIPGKEASFQYAKTDDKGNFKFNLHIDEGLKDFILMPDDISKNRKIILESSFSDQFAKPEINYDTTQINVSQYISKLSVNYQVQKIYTASPTGEPLNPLFPAVKTTRFYGKPDIELFLEDYISLPVMNEIFFELLPGVSLKKKKSAYEVSITYHSGDDLFVVSPCLMIDGVIIKDPTLIVNLDPELVEKIDVIKENYLVGKYFFTGIVNVITKTGDFSSISLPDYMIRLPYRVIDPVHSFVSPDFSTSEMKENHIPDYRNTLYWNSSVTPDENGKASVEFWSSDNKGDYIINIQGITQDGRPVSLQKILKVR